MTKKLNMRLRKSVQITPEMQERITWIQEHGDYLNESEVLRQALQHGLPDLEAIMNPGKEEK